MPQLPLLLEWPDTVDIPAQSRVRAQLEVRFASKLQYTPDWARWVSYVGNKKVPGLRLYRYKEAFSFALVQRILKYLEKRLPTSVILDPFMGMGTTPLTAMRLGYTGVGIDKLPVAVAIARGLISLTQLTPGTLLDTFDRLQSQLSHIEPAAIADDVQIVQRAFDLETRLRLQRWKAAIRQIPSDSVRQVFLLLFLSILEPCSKTSKDGQFLRLRPDKPTAFPDVALRDQVLRAEEDLHYFAQMRQIESWGPLPLIRTGDARTISHDVVNLPEPPGLIITSPPYVNRYDYTRTYSLELCFAFVDNFQELRRLRHSVLRSHIESRLDADHEPSPHPAVEEVERALRQKDLNNRRIPLMIRAYFIDMNRVIQEMARVLAPKGWVVMVVDNVRFEGEMVPVDLILSEMAETHGFEVQGIWVARFKGNSSQQMRKYGRKPVRESILLWRKA